MSNSTHRSTSHTLASAEPESLLPNDEQRYRFIYVSNPSSNGITLRVGGTGITATTGGRPLGADEGFWYPVQGIRPSDIIVAGAADKVVDTILIP